MQTLTYADHDRWKAEEAAGSLVKSGYKRVNHEPRSGEVRVRRVIDDGPAWECQWVVWVWDSVMLSRLLLVDAESIADVREVEAQQLADFEVRRLLSLEFPDQKAALLALEDLEAEEAQPNRVGHMCEAGDELAGCFPEPPSPEVIAEIAAVDVIQPGSSETTDHAA